MLSSCTPIVHVTDTPVHGGVHNGAAPAVLCLQIQTGGFDADQFDAIFAPHLKSTASWPNI